MKKITSLFTLAFLAGLSLNAQNKFSANIEFGLGIPFVELNQNTYPGYKPNLGINAGIGYQFDKASRLRGDIMAGQFNGNNATAYFQANSYEGSLSYEYNLLHIFGPVSNNFKLNARIGIGAGMMNSYLYDITTRRRLAEVPNSAVSGDAFSVQTFILGGANAGIPINKKMDINIGYAHRLLFFQPWVDAYDPNSFDTYGYVTAGVTFYLKSDKDESKIEVDPKKFQALQMKADSSDAFAAQANRNNEKVARLEMSNQEKDMQLEMMRSELDSLKANPVVVSKEVKPGKGERMVVRESGSDQGAGAANADLGPVRYRVVVVSSPTQAGAQRFIDRCKLDKSEMMIAYIEKLDTYRVIYKSSESLDSAKKAAQEARQYYSDAWIAKF
ncbi:hypothetical protein [Croceimicrobium hydrocarbonivorans]|uniref:SPOR domain-containing protein n=1 Tax=Croceimicrobium hydrocarbonivorans TaxID=2761580 RepID=A0A7H0VBF9_9FLAO|nr:hypothetical protein [Croceimicrobium hydrocarbonivorans]QNR23057.1 hypothetical protein H4K34_11785 [Croceimicrobium hydrocarbonivorans]